MADKKKIEEGIIKQLETVFDPEIHVNIYDLGLVYKIDINDNGFVNVVMTLTAPGCPVAGDIIMEVDNKIRSVEGVTDANVMLTFDPPWNKSMMSEVALLELGYL